MSSSALHDKFQQWSIAGVFTKIWQRDLTEYDELQGIAWTWQAADCVSIEAPLARRPLIHTRRIGEKKAQDDIFSSTKMKSPSRYSSAHPTSMTALLWSLYPKRPSFHRRQQRISLVPGCRVRRQRGSRPVQWLHPKYKATRGGKEGDRNQSRVQGETMGLRTVTLPVQSFS